MSKLTISIVSCAEGKVTAVPLLHELLAYGHSVSFMEAHAATEQDQSVHRTALTPANHVAFAQLTALIGIADLVVLVLPADEDAACLVGMAHISGVPVAAIRKGLSQPCPFTVRGCVSFWCEEIEDVLKVIADWPELPEEE